MFVFLAMLMGGLVSGSRCTVVARPRVIINLISDQCDLASDPISV